MPAIEPTAPAPPARDAANADDAARTRLRKASLDVETYFVSFLLKQMHSDASKGGLFGQSSASATYRDMFDDAVAKQVGSRGSLGIADMLYRTLVRNIGAKEAAVGKADGSTEP